MSLMKFAARKEWINCVYETSPSQREILLGEIHPKSILLDYPQFNRAYRKLLENALIINQTNSIDHRSDVEHPGKGHPYYGQLSRGLYLHPSGLVIATQEDMRRHALAVRSIELHGTNLEAIFALAKEVNLPLE